MNKIRLLIIWLLLAVLASACTATSTPTPNAPTVTPSLAAGVATTTTDSIDWHEWSAETFALAQAQDKPILLDLYAVWCHWCHVMDDTTYRDPLVISLVSNLFIPVRVDTDQRPDIQARYLAKGWPTTSFLTPQGDILTDYGYLTAQDLATRLQQVSQVYATNKQNFAAQFAQILSAAGGSAT